MEQLALWHLDIKTCHLFPWAWPMDTVPKDLRPAMGNPLSSLPLGSGHASCRVKWGVAYSQGSCNNLAPVREIRCRELPSVNRQLQSFRLSLFAEPSKVAVSGDAAVGHLRPKLPSSPPELVCFATTICICCTRNAPGLSHFAKNKVAQVLLVYHPNMRPKYPSCPIASILKKKTDKLL